MDALSQLTFASSDTRAPPLPTPTDPPDPRVRIWEDPGGSVFVTGFMSGEDNWLHLRDLAFFRFRRDREGVTAIPCPLADRAIIVDQFLRTVWPIVLQARGLEVLHASGVVHRAGVVALCGPPETGKSTFAYGLGRRGYPVWSDDAVVFEVVDGRPWARPVPSSIRLRSDPAAYFGHARGVDPSRRWQQPVAQVDTPTEPPALAAVCLLERDPSPDRALSVERIRAADAYPRIFEHAVYFSGAVAARNLQMATAYLDLVRSVPVFTVAYASGLEHLEAILEGVERALFSSGALEPPER